MVSGRNGQLSTMLPQRLPLSINFQHTKETAFRLPLPLLPWAELSGCAHPACCYTVTMDSKLIAVVSLAFLLPASAWSRGPEVQVKMEPVFGYERVQKLQPEAQIKSRVFYGARIVAGLPHLSAEGELIRGTDSETYPSLNMTRSDTDDRLKLGLRSSYSMGKLMSAHARGGVQASRNVAEITQSGITTTERGEIKYHPYAGAGIRSAVASNVSLVGDVVVVFGDFPDMKKNDYQTSLGFSVSFP